MKNMLAIEFYTLGWDVVFSFIKQDYWPTSSYFNCFDELYFNEDLIIEKDLEFEIPMEINKVPIIETDG